MGSTPSQRRESESPEAIRLAGAILAPQRHGLHRIEFVVQMESDPEDRAGSPFAH